MEEVGSQHVPPARAPLPDWWWEQTYQTRRVIAALVAALLLALLVWIASLIFGGGAGPTEAEAYVDALPPGREELWDDMAECESGSDWSMNSGNGFYGGLQFTEESWLGVGGTGFAHQYPREEQIMRAEFLFEEQGWGAWPRCSAELGLS